MIIIKLTPAEMLVASTVGLQRQLEAIKRNLPDSNGYEGEGWNIHVEGACGELAFAKAKGVYWEPKINTFKTGSDVGQRTQIRTRSKHEYELIIRKGDKPDQVYVLVTGEAPNFWIRGWVIGAEVKARDDWSHTYGNRPAAWFVPHAALRDIEELTEI